MGRTRGRAEASMVPLAIRWMITGFLLSFVGSTLAEGALPGLVSVGVLAVGWIAVFRTVEMLLDMTTPVTMRVLERFDPGRLLVMSEAVDVFACGIALLLIYLVSLDIAAVLLGYLFVAAVLPLVIDIAEELYIAQVVERDEASAVRFNAFVVSSSSVVGFLVGRPLGATLAELSVPMVLVANAALSTGAVWARARAARVVPTRPTVAAGPGPDGDGAIQGATREDVHSGAALGIVDRVWSWTRRLAGYGPAAPVISGGMSLATGIYVSYLVIWLADRTELWLGAVAVGLAAMGAGRSLGPWAGAWCARRFGAAPAAATFVAGQAAALVVLVLLASVPHRSVGGALWTAAVLFVVLMIAGLSTGARSLYVAVRQSRLSGRVLSRVIGVARMLSALGTLLGVWIGLALDVAGRPIPGVLLAGGVSTLLALFMIRAAKNPMEPAR